MKNLILMGSVAATLLLTGCGSSDTESAKEYSEPKVEEVVSDVTQEVETELVKLTTASRSVSFMVNKEGKSLYTFDSDTLGVSNCEGGCKDAWPIFEASVTENLDFSLISSTTQSAYKAHALYFFAGDSVVGDTKGDNVNKVWHLVYPSSDFTTTEDAKITTAVMNQNILTSAKGATLYTFDNDTSGVSNCNDECISVWPAYNAQVDTSTLPLGITADALSTITRNDGSKQLALNGKALYTFVNDTSVGNINGDWVKGVWHVVELSATQTKAADVIVQNPVEEPIVTEPTTPVINASVVFGNNGATDYTITTSSNSDVASVGANDPTLNLTVGKRYIFSVTNFASHPLHLNDASGTVLLGMGSQADTFESDSAVNFIDDGAGSITFTLTQELANQLSVYRCQFHGGMTGSITIL